MKHNLISSYITPEYHNTKLFLYLLLFIFIVTKVDEATTSTLCLRKVVRGSMSGSCDGTAGCSEVLAPSCKLPSPVNLREHNSQAVTTKIPQKSGAQ